MATDQAKQPVSTDGQPSVGITVHSDTVQICLSWPVAAITFGKIELTPENTTAHPRGNVLLAELIEHLFGKRSVDSFTLEVTKHEQTLIGIDLQGTTLPPRGVAFALSRLILSHHPDAKVTEYDPLPTVRSLECRMYERNATAKFSWVDHRLMHALIKRLVVTGGTIQECNFRIRNDGTMMFVVNAPTTTAAKSIRDVIVKITKRMHPTVHLTKV